jgi:predicted transglutaminase-like cysteine proteinase
MATLSRKVFLVLALTLTASLSRVADADSASPLGTMFPGWKSLSSSNWNVNAGAIKSWRAMLARWADGMPCESDTCTVEGWAEMVADVKAAGDLVAEVKRANALINDPAKHPYIEDINNWAKSEYWATPYQFLKKSGDAEDFAIAKYFLLRAAGVPAANMELVVVRIKALGGIGHAILAVRIDDSSALILDNRMSSALDSKRVAAEYQPAIGINEDTWRAYIAQ